MKTCEGCEAKCCRYVTVKIDEPKDNEDYEPILWYLIHENVEIFIDEEGWHILFNSKCKKLGDDFKCKDYDKRPQVCSDHKMESCERYNLEDVFASFKSPKEFRKYMKNKKIDIRKID